MIFIWVGGVGYEKSSWGGEVGLDFGFFPIYLDAGQPEVVQRGSPWYEKLSFSSLSASDTVSPEARLSFK